MNKNPTIIFTLTLVTLIKYKIHSIHVKIIKIICHQFLILFLHRDVMKAELLQTQAEDNFR